MNFYALSRRAWQIRRAYSIKTGLPVLSISWKGCLLLADSEAAAGLALLPAPRSAPDRWRAIASTGWPVSAPGRRSRVRRVAGMVASAALAAALVLIIV